MIFITKSQVRQRLRGIQHTNMSDDGEVSAR